MHLCPIHELTLFSEAFFVSSRLGFLSSLFSFSLDLIFRFFFENVQDIVFSTIFGVNSANDCSKHPWFSKHIVANEGKVFPSRCTVRFDRKFSLIFTRV